MTELHLILGIGVVAANLLVVLWGAVAWLANRPSVPFWYLLRVAQATVLAQVALGAVLLVAGEEAEDGLHYMYGAGALLVNLVAEGMRVNAAGREVGDLEFATLGATEQRAIALRIVRREMMIMTLAALLVVIFSVRAGQSSGELF